MGLLRLAKHQGMDDGPLHEVLGLERGGDHYDVYVPIERHFALWERVMRALQDPGLPVEAGSLRSVAELGVRGFSAATSSTGWEACERAIRYAHLTSDTIRFELRTLEGGVAQLQLLRDGARTLGHRCDNECALAGWAGQIRNLLDPQFVCTAVCFQHPPVADVSTHLAHFGVAPRFDARVDAIEFAAKTLDLAPGGANPAMREFFDRHAETLLAQLGVGTPGTTSQVRRTIASRLASGLPPMADVAAQLGMSERALRRQLAAEGVRYQDLVVEVRMDIAKRLLRERKQSMSDIAFVLGFSEHSAFSRFFRQHQGESPRRFRDAP